MSASDPALVNEDDDGDHTIGGYKIPRWGIPAAIVLAVVLIVVIWVVTTKVGVTNDGNTKEATLNSQYVDNQNILSDCLVKSEQSAQVAGAQTDAIDKVLSDAVKGRYDNGSQSPQVDSGKLFSALKEAYPSTAGISTIYNNVLATVNGCRTDYRGAQSKLLDELRAYDSWRTNSWTVRTFGDFPSNDLIARIGTTQTHGAKAESQMFEIVITTGAKQSYQSGVAADPNLFPTTTVAPIPTTTVP